MPHPNANEGGLCGGLGLNREDSLHGTRFDGYAMPRMASNPLILPYEAAGYKGLIGLGVRGTWHTVPLTKLSLGYQGDMPLSEQVSLDRPAPWLR
jgi:hypothetical protein